MTKEYYVPKARHSREGIDWSAAEPAAIDEYQWLPEVPVKAIAQVCYDENGFYARLTADERDITARFHGILDMVCLDSCLELFLRPVKEDKRYFNFEFNPNGALYLGFGHDRFDSVRQIVQYPKELFGIAPFKKPQGWGVEFFIPLNFIRLYFPEYELESGKTLFGNFYKCGEETIRPHYISWNRIKSETPDFHLPQQFGKWILR
jgi:hypothetical protein